MYLHTTTLYRVTTNVYGINVTQNNLDIADYETNYKSLTQEASEVTIAETTVISSISYADFKAHITGDITWADVICVTTTNRYELYILSESNI